jgi:ketosteroid isomerase-like protein
MQETGHEGIVRAYLQAFEERDLERCMAFYHHDGLLVFGPAAFGLGQFRGSEAIEQWHRDRFSGGMRVTEIDEVTVEGDTVTVKAVATSPVLKSIHLDDFRGTATFVLEEGLIRELRMGLRRGYRFHI